MTVQEYVDKRMQYGKDTLKPGYPLPTMSLEEYGEFEKARMFANTAYGVLFYRKRTNLNKYIGEIRRWKSMRRNVVRLILIETI